MIGLAGKPTLEFVKAFRALKRGVTLYARCRSWAPRPLSRPWRDATGMAISAGGALPSQRGDAGGARVPGAAWKVRRHGRAFASGAGGLHQRPRVCRRALQRAGRNPTRAAFIDATWNLKSGTWAGSGDQRQHPDRNALALCRTHAGGTRWAVLAITPKAPPLAR